MGTAWTAPAMDQILAMAKGRSDSPEFRSGADRSGSAKPQSRAARRSTPTALISSGLSRARRNRRSSWTISRSAPCGACPAAICGSTRANCVSARPTDSTTSSTARDSAGRTTCPRTGRSRTRGQASRRVASPKSSSIPASSTAAWNPTTGFTCRRSTTQRFLPP